MELAYALLETLPQASVLYHPLIDQQGRLTDFTTRYANQALQAISPGTDPQGHTQTLFQRHPFTRQHLDSFNALLVSRQAFRLDYEAPHRSLGYALSFHYVEGDMLCRYDDIADQKPAQGLNHPTVDLVKALQATNQQLRQQQGLLEGILNGSQNGLLSCAPTYNEMDQIVDLRIELVNPAASLINGLASEQLVGKTLLTAFPALADSALMAAYLHTAQTGQLQRLEAHYQDDNLTGWFEVIASPLPQQRVLISFLDITDRHQAEAAHLHQAGLMQRISESGHIGIMTHKPIWDQTGHIHDFAFTYVNEQAQRWLNVDLGQVTRQSVRFLAAGDDKEELVRQMARVVQTGASARRELTLADGRVLFLVISPLETGCVTTFMDVTQQRQVEQQKRYNAELEQQVVERTLALQTSLARLEQSKADLQGALAKEKQLSELKGRFVAMASHEFRTPLTTVLSSASLLEMYEGSQQSDKRQKHIQRIRLAVKQLNSILEEFLSSDKLTEGLVRVRPVLCEVPRLVEEVLVDLADSLKAQQTIQLSLSCPQPVWVDESLLRKILLNLLSNAIKYSGPGSVIILEGDSKGHLLSLTVSDQGIGISAEDQLRLFERFFRARNATNISGTGLGLHIVGQYVALMNGQIRLESELHQGTRITLSLPLAKSGQEP
ncbi:sensor histidine kinase [Spirosoma fluviale]|uniref:histidine kinase n=1 Tax=Spirosoma fluviale TaxID=1597977 RepID=A0A286GMZ8_9BACT|nr:PAS domain-containing sensor histidine kinase [Spirosoma fluviale]SOD96925.1 PAS domain S-box-containing protein [Spirosoma fluviale]